MPPAGVGSVTFVYEAINNTGHRLTDGRLFTSGESLDRTVYVEGEYAFTDRFSLSAGLPYVFARYTSKDETPFVFLPVDACRCWHSAFQDFSFKARYNLVNRGSFSLTPSVFVGVPSHEYVFRGEAVAGRHLREIKLGADAGLRLDRVSPRVSVQGAYSYAIVQRVLGLPNNRSNGSAQVGYSVTRRLAAHAEVSWQRTHGGLRLGEPPFFPNVTLPFPGEADTPEKQVQHDRLLRDDHAHAGAGLSYSFPKLDVFGTFTHFVNGTDAHAGRLFAMGVSIPFERTIKRN